MKQKTLIGILLIVASATQYGFAQINANNWFFGYKAGVLFNQNEIQVTTLGQLHTGEGVATISDKSGNLLFYSEGDSVWNKNHEVMPNGTDLFGNESATQSAIICPSPGFVNRYHLFTVDLLGYSNGLRYSIVDMDLDAGLGDIDTNFKNIHVESPVCEKVTATPKCDRSGYWILTHDFGTNELYSYELNNLGLDTIPVISYGQVTLSSAPSATAGYMKCSSDGRLVALAHRGNGVVEIFRFNSSTGAMTQPIVIPVTAFGISTTFGSPYGIEFSPNNQFLYVTWSQVGQGFIGYMDVSQLDSTSIANSCTVLDDSLFSSAIQLAPNGYLYTNTGYFLSEIRNPNQVGGPPIFLRNQIDLLGRLAASGLPNFIPANVLNPVPNKTICLSDSIQLQYAQGCADQITWNFGDPGSGTANTSSDSIVVHYFSDTGTFQVTLIVNYSNNADTFQNNITVRSAPSIDLGPNIELCATHGDSVKLGLNGLFGSYSWNNGSTDSVLWVNTDGIYSLTFMDVCGEDSDTIQIFTSELLDVRLPRDTTICEDSFLLSPTVSNLNQLTSFQWSNGDTTFNSWINRPLNLNFTVQLQFTATNGCGSDSDTAVLHFAFPPDGHLPADSTLCSNPPFYLSNLQTSTVTYEWSNGTDSSIFQIDSSGSYWLKSSSECGDMIDSFKVQFNGDVFIELGSNKLICENEFVTLTDTINLNPTINGSKSYAWNTGETTSTIEVSDTGWYVVSVSYNQCQNNDSIYVGFRKDCSDECKPALSNVITPNGDGLNDVFGPTMNCKPLHFSLQIFNRWGMNVFESTNSQFGWDGFINGVLASDGVYFYTLQYSRSSKEKMHFYRGNIQLMSESLK